MSIRSHKDAFDAIYRRPDLRLPLPFPLSEIEQHDWRRGPQGNAYYGYHYRRFSCHILDRLQLETARRVLVVGSGGGSDEKNIRALFPEIELWSVDISQEMILNALESGSPSRFALAMAEALPFPDASFDRVLSREVIEHVLDPAAMVAEIGRVLAPGGLAVITTENEDSLAPANFYTKKIQSPLAAALGHSLPQPEFKDEAPSREEVEAFARAAGLELVETLWDGALYKNLIQLQRLRLVPVARWARWFGRLEHGRLAPLFCDQVKFLLARPGPPAPLAAIEHVCPSCRGALRGEPELTCEACGRVYPRLPALAGVPDLIPYDEDAPAEPEPPASRSSRAYRAADFVLRRTYFLGYLASATCAALIAPNRDRRGSGHLAADDPLQEFLAP